MENLVTWYKFTFVVRRKRDAFKSLCRMFSHDVTAAILVSQTSPVGVGLFLMQTLSFVSINLHICWPRE